MRKPYVLVCFIVSALFFGLGLGYMQGKHDADRWWNPRFDGRIDAEAAAYQYAVRFYQDSTEGMSYDHAMAARRTNWLERQLKYRQHEIDVLAECHYQTSPPKTAWCARELEEVDTDKRGMRYEAESFGWSEGKP